MPVNMLASMFIPMNREFYRGLSGTCREFIGESPKSKRISSILH